MDQLMWVVTFVALSLAVGMSVIAVKLLGGERRRSAARVAALENAALADDIPEFEDAGEDYVEPDAPIDLAYAAYEPAPEPEPVLARPMLREPAYDDFRAPSAPMFAATDEPKAPSRRWLALAAVAVAMAGLVGTGYVLLKPTTLGASAAATPTAPASAASAPPSAPATPDLHQPPIELLSLKHTVDGTSFTVAGLVQNPINGAPLSHVVAVVYLFDGEDAYFATGRADLEFRGLRPGEESPFTIKVPNTSRVGRYRVGFRRDDGSVIAHVDKRGQANAALMTEGK